MGTLVRACPYHTMFPLEFPLGALSGARPGDWVLDPFCGRGTTLFAARLLGLPSVGVDISPVAVGISRGVLASARPDEVVDLACRLLAREAGDPPGGPFWELAYHPETLRQIVRLRAGLLGASGDVADVLRLLVLGRLHGPVRRVPTYLSNQMPRTFAPKPDYAVRFWARRGLRPPRVDAVGVVAAVAHRYLQTLPPRLDGTAVLGDARTFDFRAVGGPYRFVVTSPPYPGMRTYVPDQWLRSWFVGGPPRPVYAYAGQLAARDLDRYAADLSAVWANVARACLPGARLVVRFGAKSGAELAAFVRSLEKSPFRVRQVVPAGNAGAGRRQARQFGNRVEAAPGPPAEFDFTAELT